MKKEVKKKLKRQFREDGDLTKKRRNSCAECLTCVENSNSSTNIPCMHHANSLSKQNSASKEDYNSNSNQEEQQQQRNEQGDIVDSDKSGEEEGVKMEEYEEPVIDVAEIRTKLILQQQLQQTAGNKDSPSSSSEEEDEEEARERVVTLHNAQVNQEGENSHQDTTDHNNKQRLHASESSEQESYYRHLFDKREPETEHNPDNEEDNSDASPKLNEEDEEDDDDEDEEEDNNNEEDDDDEENNLTTSALNTEKQQLLQLEEISNSLTHSPKNSTKPDSQGQKSTSATKTSPSSMKNSKSDNNSSSSSKKNKKVALEMHTIDQEGSKLLSKTNDFEENQSKNQGMLLSGGKTAAKQRKESIDKNRDAHNSSVLLQHSTDAHSVQSFENLLNDTQASAETSFPLGSNTPDPNATGANTALDPAALAQARLAKKKKKKQFNWQTYSRMVKYSRRHWKISLLGYVCLVFQSVSQVFIPSFSGQLLDATIKERDMAKLNSLALYAALVFTINGLSSFLRTFIFSLVGERVLVDIRSDSFKCFIQNQISFHDKFHSGELISRLGNDISTAKAAASGNMSSTLRNIIVCIGNVIMLFWISKNLFIVIAVMIPVFLYSSSVYGRYLKKLTKKYQDFSARVSSHASECFSNIKTVKAFSNEDKEITRFDNVMKQCYDIGYKKSLSSGLYNCINSLVSDMATLAVLWYGGYLVLRDSDLTSGQLASVVMYTGSLASATNSISSSLSKIVTATGASHRLFKLMDKKPKITTTGGKIFEEFKGEIEFKDVGFRYKGTKTSIEVLSGFNLAINPGDRVALVGQSGSGKSTIIRLIERFYDVTAGAVMIDGHDIKDIDLNYLHSHIGYVSQEPLLFSGTIEENIAYGLKREYTEEQLDEVCRLANAYDFIHSSQFPLGYQTLVGEAGAKLSGGQKQRIAISRALILKPKILIFDEATSALDSESEFQVQQAIDELMAVKKDMTIIVVAHRLSTIVNCDKIVVLNKGVVVEIGDHKTLLDKGGIYKNLVDRQLSGLTAQ